MSADVTTLLGGIFVGDAAPYLSLRPLLGRELPGEPGSYLSASGAEPPAGLSLPDDAQVCSCNNVSARSIRQLIRGEHGDACTDLGELKTCSRAGTQCGSCLPDLRRLAQQASERDALPLVANP